MLRSALTRRFCLLALISIGIDPAIAIIPLANVTAVAAGGDHTCAIVTGGGIKCWGENGFGQLGDGTQISRMTPVDVPGLTGIAAITVGFGHTCALTSGGGVKCWGDNLTGQLGDGTTTTSLTPVDVTGLTTGVMAINAGYDHTCALTIFGGVKCWGYNQHGQLGDGTTTQHLSPVNVTSLSFGVAAITGARDHTCALTIGGGVKCWGGNGHGQVGDGSFFDRLAPVNVTGLAGPVGAIAAGGFHTCALTTGGSVKCWGGNINGELGDGTTTDRLAPVDVPGLPAGIARIDTGVDHTCARTNGGGVKCWGGNFFGELGDGTFTNHSTAVDVAGLASGVTEIATGSSYTCALIGGGLRCWGSNVYGQLGNGVPNQRATPVDVAGIGTTVAELAAAGDHTCARIGGSGVKCWGSNTSGQLGDGTVNQRFVPVNVVGLAGGVSMIAAGYNHTCSVSAAGAAKCWGFNGSGQLGDGTIIQHATPTDVAFLADGVEAITGGTAHTCAVVNGGARCWGANFSGQLGDNTTNQRLTPVSVNSLTSGVYLIAAGYNHSCASGLGGGAKCWGSNGSGQLGDGTVATRTSPVIVMGLSTSVNEIAAGDRHTCAWLKDETVRCWGENGLGQLGDGTTTDRLTAVIVSGLSGPFTALRAITAGGDHACALLLDGTIRCWGSNSRGQLGDGTFTSRTTAVNVQGLPGVVTAIAAGADHTCAALMGGGVKCWGSNISGELGNGESGYQSVPVVVVTQGVGPTVATSAAIGVTNASAVLNGLVSSNGAVTTVTFEYGFTTSYGNMVIASQSPLAAGAVNATVSATIGALACGSTYHFRAVGANGEGNANGGDSSLTTLACVLPPTVVTNAANGVFATGATLNGTVSSNGATTTVAFQYGTTTGYGGAIAATPGPLAPGATNAPVSAAVGGLACSTTYHFRAVGSSSAGTINGNDVSFTTTACQVPDVFTDAPGAITANAARLNGRVYSNGALTTVIFKYGPTTNYGSTIAAVQSPLPAGAANAPVSATIAGLTCNTLYHYTATGTNSNGASVQTDFAFVTAACASGAPSVTTSAAAGVTATGATLNGTVSSNGAGTAANFQYGLTANYSDTIAATQSPLGSNAVNVSTSKSITGLACSTLYHFRVVGVNSVGTTAGADATFATGVCPVSATRLDIAPSAPLTFVATVTSNGSGKVRFVDGYFPDTPLSDYTCPAVPTGSVGGSCNAMSSCTQLTLDVRGQAACAPDISCLSQQQGCHYITAVYEGGNDPSSTSAPLAFPVIPPAPAHPDSVSGGNGDAVVSFTPKDNGGLPVTGFTVTATRVDGAGPAVVVKLAAPTGLDVDAGSLATTHIVTGLANGVEYAFEVTVSNQLGTSPPSALSSSVTPVPGAISAYSRNYLQKVYVAYYGRPADSAGQDYWASRMDGEGQSLASIIAAFGSSEEFSRRYGGLSAAQLITRIYQQALGRDPDPAGLAYYVGELLAGSRTLQTITLDVLNGASTAPDATVVSNRMEVASYYTSRVASGCAYGGEQQGVDTLSSVTADVATVIGAKVTIDARCGLLALVP